MPSRRRTATVLALAVAGGLGSTRALVPRAAAQVPPPAAEAGRRPPDGGYIGDSLGVESQEEILAAFHRRRPFVVLAVANGAYVSWVRRHWLQAILRDPPSILVVGLGHADANNCIPPPEFDRQVRAFLREITPHVDCIRWLNVRRRITYYPPVNVRSAAYNRILRRAAARHPEVEVVDYSAWVDLVGNRRFERDRMHLTPVGERAFARMVRQAADSCDPTLTTGPFRDLPDHDPAASAAAWLHQQGIARDDHGDRTFRARLADADVPLLRRDLARWLWRQQGRPTGSPLPVWTYVPFPLWEPVAWLAERRLLAGLPGDRFGPDRPVRRHELVRALWSLAGRPPATVVVPWPDVPAAWAAPFAWAAEAGVITGYGDGTVRPGAVLSRSAAARAVAPTDLADPAPRPPLGGPYPAPRRLGGDARQAAGASVR